MRFFYDKNRFKPRKGPILSWAALGAVVICGFSFIATKVALREVHPLLLLTLRYAIGALLLLFAQYGLDKALLRLFSHGDRGLLANTEITRDYKNLDIPVD